MLDVFLTDMIEEVLIRLPVKSLLRFKCVSKNWCDLIQSKRFVHLHNCYDGHQDHLFFEIIDYPHDRFEATNGDRLWLPDPCKARCRMGPIKGLFCEVRSQGHIVLWNPATLMIKKVSILPAPELYDLSYGFGLDPLSGDYKVVAFDRNKGFASIYNWRSDCWKGIVDGIVDDRILYVHQGNRHAAFSNGVYYWPVVLTRDWDKFSILTFDMMTERFGQIKLPDGIFGRIRMVAWGDSISLLSSCELWVMGKQGCWRKCYEFTSLGRQMSPVYVWKGEILMLDELNANLIAVDMTTQKVRRIESPYRWCERIFSIFPYTETFVSIESD